jgi:hypothetical protein
MSLAVKWGIRSLPPGQPDLAAAPPLDDGVHFSKYVEGVPGMQPERLGPYVTTLNPGCQPAKSTRASDSTANLGTPAMPATTASSISKKGW